MAVGHVIYQPVPKWLKMANSPWWKYLVCGAASGVFAFVIPQRI